jgi:predicted nucleic acid-binding protein
VIVLDASAFVDAVAGRTSVVDRLEGEDIHAPQVIDVEVLSALRRFVATGRVDVERVADALGILEPSDIHRHPHTPLLRLAWPLRDTVSAYDAAYVTLAAALDVPLVTADRRLAMVPNLPRVVEVP